MSPAHGFEQRRVISMRPPTDIVDLYRQLPKGNLTRQAEIAAEYVDAPSRLATLCKAGKGPGRVKQTDPFYPVGSRGPLKKSWPPSRTEHVAWRLWDPPVWSVGASPTLNPGT